MERIIDLTFISSDVKLTKRYHADGTSESYPNRSRVSTTDIEVGTLQDFYEAIKTQGKKGAALLKGNTTRQLKGESRRGMVDRDKKSRWLCIDIDGLDIHVSAGNGQTKRLGELVKDGKASPTKAIEWLQEALPELKGVACILQYSASYMLAKDAFSAHLFYLLDREYTPRELKAYLGLSNFEERILPYIRLSDSKSAIQHIIDPSVADNSKLIYIAPPVCDEGVEDPFPGDIRYQMISGDRDFLTLPRQKLDYGKYQAQKNKVLKELRTKEGLPTDNRSMPKLQRLPSGALINTNPGEGTISIVSVDEEHVRCNVNGGDSQAYWFKKGPIGPDTLMFNFKGEEPFLIRAFDPDFADAWNRENYPDAENKMPVAFVFRDPTRNKYYTLEHDPETNMRRINAIDTGQPIKDFYLNRGMAVQETFEEWTLEFVPPETWFLDPVNKRINTFIPSEFILEKEPFPEEVTSENAIELLKTHCPNHYMLIHHALGGSDEHLHRFVNWMACHMQSNHRGGRRVDTAWIVQGVPGTGKSSLLTNVIEPILNTESTHYATHRSLKNLNDTHNGWLETALFVEVEEAYLPGMGNDGAALLENVIKPMITDKTVIIREMRKDQRSAINHAAYIFTTNRSNPLKIQHGDRRFHVAPRQETPLNKVVDTMELFAELDKERQLFTNYLFSHYADFKDAKTVRDDAAKRQLAESSMSTMERMGKAIREGDIWWMLSTLIMSEPDESDFKLHGDFIMARSAILGWLLRARTKKKMPVLAKDLRTFYSVIMADRPFKSTQAFKKAMYTQTGIELTHVLLPGKGKHVGVEVRWDLSSFPDKETLQQYVQEAEKLHVAKKQLKTVGK